MTPLHLRRLFLGLRARFHLWSGRRAYRAGRLSMAHRHLGTAVACGHGGFATFLLLGKIAYRERDLHRAADFFERAHVADPGRFALEGFPRDFIDNLRQQPELTTHTPYRVVIEAEARARSTVGAVRGPSSAQRSSAEQARLDGRPPIQPGEGGEIDWDAEARKLFDRR